MKKLSLALAVVIGLSVLTNGVAYAGDEGWYAAGGLLGGLLLGSAISNNNNYYYSRPCPQPVYVYEPAPVIYTRPYNYHNRGYYPSPYGRTTVYERRVVSTW